MPSVELSKLPGVSPVRALATSDRTQVDARTLAAPSRGPDAGISVELSAGPEASTPPVDAERVQEIRAALRDGSYPLVPTKIVDAMIAAQVSLSLPEQG
ncbi:MAG TPA: flagellar biosynthesis anti-sigma factor FlgM [Erythrobacter sp.]|nr:flagellar biosynthesis anti-sigma factor FlgM [Erythrobacter sp.]